MSVKLTLLTLLTHFRAIEVRTIDGYQGKEKEVVLLSLTRCNREFEAEFEIFCLANQNRVRYCFPFGQKNIFNSVDLVGVIQRYKAYECGGNESQTIVPHFWQDFRKFLDFCLNRILLGDSQTYRIDEDYETLLSDLRKADRIINIPKFNKMFNVKIEIDQEQCLNNGRLTRY